MNKNESIKLWNQALILAAITISYNFFEGIISIFFGWEDETLSLFGFGVDSFVEVISGMGILHMVIRVRIQKVETRDRFERLALYITSISFFLLTAGLLIGAGLGIYTGHTPTTTIAGVIVALISIATMRWLVYAKTRVGEKLNSAAILADAECTMTCFRLSIILLVASLAYELFKISYIDILGSLGIAWYSWKEGVEALEKARSDSPVCTDHCC